MSVRTDSSPPEWLFLAHFYTEKAVSVTLTAFIKNKAKFTKSLKEENFTIIGHMNGAGEVLGGLC